MEDMGNQGAREQSTCGHPALGPHNEDLTQKAVNGDAYATRHNPAPSPPNRPAGPSWSP
ncbi:MAG TPA: hypothetical protein VGN49_13900 [Micrococcaceae bacterium]|jgi:hypothetical protein|nr:hypothetical protein [Micrococcaceae bacterium]